MGLFSAMYTGLSGLSVNSEMISVTGNNIANVNTPGFKSSRIEFETQFLRNLGSASAPTTTSGGTNPTQVGLGTRIAGVTRNFSNGTIQPTGINTDMAIEGAGFFVGQRDGIQHYTRVGAFSLDRDYNLVNNDGYQIMGYGIDNNFEVVEGGLQGINIPLGVLTLAEATDNVTFAGNLNAAGDAATIGSISTFAAIFSDAGATIPAVAGDALTSLYNGLGGALFASGDVITITGVSKGGATLPDHTFEVGATNTTDSDANGTLLSDFTTFLDEVLGIDSSVDPTAGVTISAAGEIVVTGNLGEGNNLIIENADIIVNADTTPTLPFDITQTQEADGESVRTTFVAYDSLGVPMTIDMTMVLESKDNTGTTWRFYTQSEDDSDLDRVMGNGTISFDNNGRVTTVDNPTFIIDRTDTGASTPQQITLGFENANGTVSALADVRSQLTAQSQDGSPIGTLQDFNVSEDGTVVGIFSNSLLRNLGRVVLANFSNPKGLVEIGNNLFDVTVNAGIPQIGAPGSAGTGRIVGGAMELSNVELSAEFINLITASTGFSASSRVLSTSDRLIQELLATIR